MEQKTWSLLAKNARTRDGANCQSATSQERTGEVSDILTVTDTCGDGHYAVLRRGPSSDLPDVNVRDPEFAARIAACVNAFAGLDHVPDEPGAVKRLVEALVEHSTILEALAMAVHWEIAPSIMRRIREKSLPMSRSALTEFKKEP